MVAALALHIWGAEQYMPVFERRPTYERVGVWLRSSACSAERFAFLAVCRDGVLLPVERFSGAEDRGHTLLANLWGAMAGRAITRAELVRLNWAINAAGLATLAGLLYASGLPVAAVVGVALLVVYGVPGRIPGPDVFSALPGILALALVPAFALVLLGSEHAPRRAARKFLVAGSAVALWSAYLLRSALGVTGMLAFAVALAMCAVLWRRVGGRWGAVLVLVVVAAPGVPHAFFWARTILLNVPPAATIRGHGFAHNLYIGLGVYPNRWGIRYEDDSGWEAVKQLRPGVEYCSAEYYAVLRRRYVQLVAESPAEVVRQYAWKYADTMRLSFADQALPYGVAHLVLPAALLLAWLGRGRRRGPDAMAVALLALAWAAVVTQTVLTKPFLEYVYATEPLLILLMAATLDGLRCAARQYVAQDCVLQRAVRGTPGAALLGVGRA
jgi:hypothetical protein